MLPLSKEELPPSLQKFGNPNAKEGARMMAARGLVPVKGEDLVSLLVQLTADPVLSISEAAQETLSKVPEGVLKSACSAELHPEFLSGLWPHIKSRPLLLGELAANRHTPERTVREIARVAEESICERIATDQNRLLAHPEIIEALYKNPKTRMSTVDRLVELAARNGVELRGVATFAAHVEAIEGQLIPEPSDEPLPGDQTFTEALEHDGDDDAFDHDKVTGAEELKSKNRPLSIRIAEMSPQDKMRLALIGNATARGILVRDRDQKVAKEAVRAMAEAEAEQIAGNKEMPEEILRYIGTRREWLGNYRLKRDLMFNAKTPVGISMKFLSHLRLGDLRALSRSRNIPAGLKAAALQRAEKKSKG